VSISLKLLEVTQEPLIGRTTPGTEDNRWGMEGGLVVKEGDTVHLFTTEVFTPPKFDNTRLAHWQSADGLRFERVGTVIDAKTPCPEELHSDLPWTPYPIFNEEEDRWNLFYTGYQGGHQEETRRNAVERNWGTPIIRAVSTTSGREGIGGPYNIEDCAFHGGTSADEWEGKGSAVSFFPFRVEDRWLAFFGCNQFNTRQNVKFLPGLAESPSLQGPWKRLTHRNPVCMDDRFVENPVVYDLGEDEFITFYDGETVHGIAYATSKGGEVWSKEQVLWLESPPTPWAWWLRTPLGMIPRDQGGFWLYYTAFDYAEFDPEDPTEKPFYHRGFGTVGRIGIEIERS